MSYIKKLDVGNIKLNNNVFLAPMAGVTDIAFRKIVREVSSPALTFTEMASSKAMEFGSNKTEKLLKIPEYERPSAVQIFGSNKAVISDTIKKLNEDENIDIIDINMGCPVPKVVNIGCGSALMKDIKTAYAVAESAVKASEIPVTVKFRSGWNDKSINAVEFAKAMESAGVSAIAVHGRTREQFYSGKADWNIIADVKKNVTIPVIANGDVTDLKSCLDMYEKTGCDLVMIGRASYGNPFIFDEIKAHFEGREYIPPSPEKKMQIMLEHIRLILKFSEKPEEIAIREARKISAWYMNGYYGCAKFRVKCYSLESYSQAENLAEEFLKVQREHSL